MAALAPALQAYFTERLINQRAASPNTIAAYRTTFRLLLGFTAQQTGTAPSNLNIDDVDAALVGAFLDYLEKDRGNCPATRNNRLAAIHSLFGYLALQHPEHAECIQRVLAIPPKRTERHILTYLTDQEAEALLASCDQTTWTGRRDHAMLAMTLQTGLRISEVAGLTRADVTLTVGAHVHTIGKGRKERRTPLIASTKAVLKAWLAELGGDAGQPLFPGTTGKHLSRDAIERRLARHLTTAARTCPSLQAKPITMHTPASHRDAPAARRKRHHRHRPLARPRADIHHHDLPARGHDPQAAGHRPDQATGSQTRSLPTPDTLIAFLESL